jgi:VIT1/CCC1 family predicted Fe2+/Mn2+ transporter
MGAVGYTSAVSQRDYYHSEQAREAAEIAVNPDAERQEIRDIYAAKGFTGLLLGAGRRHHHGEPEPVARHDDGRGAVPAAGRDSRDHAQLVRDLVATLLGHLIPLIPFVWMPRTPALVLAIVLSALVLFGVGVYSAVTLKGSWWRGGARMAVIGLGAAGVGFLIGHLFQRVGG